MDMDVANTYQHYKKWHQKRLDIQEKMKSKLNESLVSVQSSASMPQSNFYEKNARKDEVPISPRAKESLRKQMQEFMGKRAENRGSISKTDRSSVEDKSQGRFEDFLNIQFSSFINRVPEDNRPKNSRLKSNVEDIKGKYKDCSPRRKEEYGRSNSPILKLKKGYDLAKRKVSAHQANSSFLMSGMSSARGQQKSILMDTFPNLSTSNTLLSSISTRK